MIIINPCGRLKFPIPECPTADDGGKRPHKLNGIEMENIFKINDVYTNVKRH